MEKFKVGDSVPYINALGNTRLAEITLFTIIDSLPRHSWCECNTEPEVDDPRTIWFYGIDAETKEEVFHPLYRSKKLINKR